MKLTIIGDFWKENKTQVATNPAINHSLTQIGVPLDVEWVHTSTIPARPDKLADAFLIAPGSPYADHAESNPYASRLVVTPLTCSLTGQRLDVDVRAVSLAFQLAGPRLTENYYCNFGLNRSTKTPWTAPVFASQPLPPMARSV